MHRSIGSLIVSAFLWAGCISYADLPEQIKIYAAIPQNTRSVAVRLMPMKPGAVKNLEGTVNIQSLFTQSLKEALAHKQPAWRIDLREGETIAESDLVANAEILEVDGGSAGARFMIGFSAGAARSVVKVSVLDRAGKELANAEIFHSTMCPIGWCAESNEGMIQRNLQSLAGEVADFIINPPEYEKRKRATKD